MIVIKQYGDAGVLILPWQDYSVPLYNGKTAKNAQAIVDRENSAEIKRRFGGGHCDYIADHAGQGFDIIRECRLNTPAVVQTPSSSRIYRWTATMKGKNTGKNLIACSGQAHDDGVLQITGGGELRDVQCWRRIYGTQRYPGPDH